MAKIITGRVSSDRADKSIVVTVTSRKTHPIYKKQYTVNSKYMAHDEKNEAKIGDRVIIRESRPLSARKRFMLHKILETSGEVFMESDAEAGVEIPEKVVMAPKPKAKKDETKPADKGKTEVKEK